MKTILKYPLPYAGWHQGQDVRMPPGARILTVQMQGERGPQLWALVDNDKIGQDVRRDVYFVGTGHPLDDKPGTYVGTFQDDDGRFVWHVFDRGEIVEDAKAKKKASADA